MKRENAGGKEERRNEKRWATGLGRMEGFWGAEARSCRLAERTWFKYSSTFPGAEYSGHSWSSIMPDIHSHCQRWQNEWWSGRFSQRSNLQKSTGNCHLSQFVSRAAQIVHQLPKVSHWNSYWAFYPCTFLLSRRSEPPQLCSYRYAKQADTVVVD